MSTRDSYIVNIARRPTTQTELSLGSLAGLNTTCRSGVIEEGAYADILIVDGNQLENLSVIGTNDKWFDAPPPRGRAG